VAGSIDLLQGLRRAGVRLCVLRESRGAGYRLVDSVPRWRMGVFVCNPGATRAYIASSSQVAPDPADLAWQRTLEHFNKYLRA